MEGPPMRLIINPTAEPVAVHIPIPVPILFARLGILVCDLYLTYHTEHILIFLALYCNNRISVSNCILEAPNFFIICIILTIVLCRHVL